MRKLLSSCAALLLLCAPCLAASSNSGLKGTVTDLEGAALSGPLKVRILVHWDPAGADVGLKTNVGIPKDLTAETDSRGSFQIELAPGFYDVFVSAMGFSPVCRKIRIKPGQVATFNPKLEVDPLVTRELADRPF